MVESQQAVLPTSLAEVSAPSHCNGGSFTVSLLSVNVILTPVFPQMLAISLEIKRASELLDKDGESAEDDEILDVSAFLVRIQCVKPNTDHSPAIYSNSYLISMSRCLMCGTTCLIDSHAYITAISIHRTTGKNDTPRRAIIYQP